MEVSLSTLLNSQVLWLTFILVMLALSFTLGAVNVRLDRIKTERIGMIRQIGASLDLDVEAAVKAIEDDGTP